MQRGTYVIAIAPGSVEGGLVLRGAVQPEFSQSMLKPAAAPDAPPSAPAPASAPPAPPAGAEAAGEPPAPAPLLATFLEQAQWERGLVTAVLPTEQVSVRRLSFAFSDPKKVRQVLPFELGQELIDGVEGYTFDAQIQRNEDGTADVLVFLTDKAPVEEAAALLDRNQLSLHRATFSAQALVEANPVPEGHHFYVYAGSEEAFVAQTSHGRLRALQSFSPHPGELLDDLMALGAGSPHDQLQALFRADDDDPARTTLRDQLKARLEGVLAQANRFLRINAGSEPFTVSVAGLFGALYSMQPDGRALALAFPAGAWPGPKREHFGVLGELLGSPGGFPAPRGFSFHKRIGTSLALLRELRWPATAAAVLLVLLVGLLGSGYFLRASALENRLAALNAQLQRTLAFSGPVTTVTVTAAMNRVQEEVDRLRKEREAVAYIERYHYDMLRLLRDVSLAVREQPQVTVDALTFNPERFTLAGATPSYSDSEGLKNRIAALSAFADREVKVSHSNAGNVIRYRLTVER